MEPYQVATNDITKNGKVTFLPAKKKSTNEEDVFFRKDGKSPAKRTNPK